MSNNPEKVTNPGIKQVWRFTNGEGSPLADLICLEDESPGAGQAVHLPPSRWATTGPSPWGTTRSITPLLGLRMKEGRIVGELPNIAAMQARARGELDRLDDTYKRLINPHVYKVSLSDGLSELKSRLIRESLSRGAHD